MFLTVSYCDVDLNEFLPVMYKKQTKQNEKKINYLFTYLFIIIYSSSQH